ncbi:uncharacterized protein LOC134404277 [Elgaria multicarinata webbii]|uniref:uncharacterized protein LOC134404277 n=1 Tax=Elgaria multicarinata webbii TaxID=159646 RepID=UPI002FCCE4D8
MPPKKGLGGKKGKGKAPQPPVKRPRPRHDSSSDEGERPDIAAFMARLQAAELERGIIPPPDTIISSSGAGGSGRPHTRRQTHESMWASVAARLDAIEASSSHTPPGPELTSGQDGSVNNQTQPLPGVPDNPPATIATQPPPGTWPPLMSGSEISGTSPLGKINTGGHAEEVMGDWQLEIETAMWQSLAPSTRAAYKKASSEFHLFRDNMQLPQI